MWGRVDHIENRLVGIKSREIYEAPAALVAPRGPSRAGIPHAFQGVAPFQDAGQPGLRPTLIYNGLWFSQLHQDLMAFTVSNQQYVSGIVRVKLFKGHAQTVGRKSEHSLYRHELATYEEGDQYDLKQPRWGSSRSTAWGQTTQAKHQLLRGAGRPATRASQHHPALSRRNPLIGRNARILKGSEALTIDLSLV